MIRRILLLCACLLLGFASGQGLRGLVAPTGTKAAVGPSAVSVENDPMERGSARNLAAPRAVREAAAPGVVAFDAPADMADFRARIDEVLSAARAGSEQAALSLWEHLSECDGDTANELRHARTSFKRDMKALEKQAEQLHPDVLEGRRKQAARFLATAEDRDALCGDLGDQRGAALGWLELAMARGSKPAVRQVMESLARRMDTEATSRYAQRLVRLRDAALQRLTDGDLSRGPDAPRMMMLGHTSGLLPYDEAKRAGYAYAWWLARSALPEEGVWIGPSPLEEQRLSPQERAGAERIGTAAFEACCA